MRPDPAPGERLQFCAARELEPSQVSIWEAACGRPAVIFPNSRGKHIEWLCDCLLDAFTVKDRLTAGKPFELTWVIRTSFDRFGRRLDRSVIVNCQGARSRAERKIHKDRQSVLKMWEAQRGR